MNTKKEPKIYKITNTVTGKIYIGQTIQPLYKRWFTHKSAKRVCPLTSSLKKHGPGAFTIEPLCSVLKVDDLDEVEIYFIALYGCIYPNGYNLASGGGIAKARRGVPPWNKGKKATEEAKRNQSLAHRGQSAWNKGIPLAEETKQKLSIACMGRARSPSTQFNKGIPSAFKGKEHTETSRALIKQNNGAARQVMCVETQAVYPSIIEASKATGIDKTSLGECVRGSIVHRRTGLSFKFVD